jgi:hypothetical protein
LIPVADVQLTSNKQYVLGLPLWANLGHISLTQMFSKDQMAGRLVQLKKSNRYQLAPVNYRVVRPLQGLEMVKVSCVGLVTYDDLSSIIRVDMGCHRGNLY